MAVEFLLDGLKELLVAADAARVVAGLRQDPLVWSACDDQAFCENALAFCGGTLRLWTPSVLSLIAQDETAAIEGIAVEPMKPLSAGLRQRSVRVYEDTRKKGIYPATLGDAGLLGLALRERRRLTGSWAGLTGELLTAPSGIRSIPPGTWKTSLACLAGFIPDLNDLVGELVGPEAGEAGLEWLVHILSVLPFEPEEHAQRILHLIRNLTRSNQLDVLKSLRLKGFGEAVAKTANLLVREQTHLDDKNEHAEACGITMSSLTEEAIRLQQLASLHHLAGNPAQADKALKAAGELVTTIQAGLDLQAVNLERETINEARLNQAVESLPAENQTARKMMKQVGLAINASGSDQHLRILTGSKESDPFLSLQAAQNQWMVGSREVAGEMGHAAAEELVRLIQKSPLYIGGDFAYTVDFTGFVRSLAELGLPDDAVSTAESALQADPANPELLDIASQIHQSNGDLRRSKYLASIAAHLKPEDLKLIRHLAAVHEALGDWQQAMRCRKDCLDHPEGGGMDDRVAYARAALNSGDVDTAAQTCEEILSEVPDHGSAHGLLGLTRAAQDRDEDAIMHLNRATLVASEEAEWWLALAGLYQKMGDIRTALETLRAAVLASPESGDIHYELGEMYLDGGMNSEALPHLKRAAKLQPENSQVAFRLGKALHSLGFMSEARQVIDGLKDQWAVNPDIAFEYAGIALALNEVDSAVPAFEIAAQSKETRPEWLLTYASLLLNDHIHAYRIDEDSRYQHAEAMLRKSLEMTPNDLWTSILLAEALVKEAKFNEAYEMYQGMVERPEVVDKGWMWRIQHGFGLSSIGLDQIEAGITMLQEAIVSRPESLEVIKDLTAAYLTANLQEDAGETAERALDVAPDDHENLGWFAGIMMRLGKPERAAEAMRCAIELSPHQSDLRVRFAQLAVEIGNIQDAKDALRKLPDLDRVDPELLRQAAYLHLRIQEPQAAIENLEKAVILSDTPNPVLLNDLAGVYAEQGRVEDAIETMQKIPDANLSVSMQVFYADLLAKQNRYQAAMLVIEKALKAILKTDEGDDVHLAGIYARSAKWSRELGNVSSAFEQVEKALDYEPDDLNLRFLAANLASAMLMDEKASKYALLPFEAVNRKVLDSAGLALAGLSGHLALEADRIDDARSLYDVCAKNDSEDPWVQSLNARLLVRRGEIPQAGEVIQSLLAKTASEKMDPGDATLWVARAAFESYFWQESFRIYDTLISKYSTEGRSTYELAKAMVEAVESQNLCNELGVKTHAPGVDGGNDQFQHRFEELFKQVQPMLGGEEALRWNRRAKLAMGIELTGSPDFSEFTYRAMDAAAAMAALRVMKNETQAIQVGEPFENEIPVIAQKALCLIDTNLPAGLEAAEKLVAMSPGHPLYLALYARMAQKSGDDGNALQAIEEALRLWPDEPNWHAWAGDLALRMDDINTSLQHLKQALALEPENAEFSAEVGHVLGLNGEYPEAIAMLTKAVEIAPDQTSAWLGLARAQKGLGLIDEAILSSLKAKNTSAGLAYASQICQENGRGEKALEYARSAYHQSPTDPKAIVNLSRILNSQNKSIESLELISQSIDDLEPSRELLFERANLVFQIQGAEAAGALVDQLIEDYPEDPESLALHANVQAELGQLKAAERSAFRSLRLQPHQPGLALALARMNRKAGQLDQAVHLLGQAAAMDPHNIDIYLELGQAYIDRREHSMALQAFEKATKIAPKDSRGYFQSALILKETKDYSGAEAMLEQAAKFAPEDLVIHRQLVGVMALNLIHKSQEASKAL